MAWALEPGPIEPSVFPIGRLVDENPPQFSKFATDYADDRRGAEGQLASISDAIVKDGIPDVLTDLDDLIEPAKEATGWELQRGAVRVAPEIFDVGDDLHNAHDSVREFLPSSEDPVPTDTQPDPLPNPDPPPQLFSPFFVRLRGALNDDALAIATKAIADAVDPTKPGIVPTEIAKAIADALGPVNAKIDANKGDIEGKLAFYITRQRDAFPAFNAKIAADIAAVQANEQSDITAVNKKVDGIIAGGGGLTPDQVNKMIDDKLQPATAALKASIDAESGARQQGDAQVAQRAQSDLGNAIATENARFDQDETKTGLNYRDLDGRLKTVEDYVQKQQGY